MRLSRLFFRTFKDAPAEAETASHRFLEQSGYIKKLGKGLYIYTPIMWRVLQKLMAIIREELNRAGAQELSLPMLHPAEVWRQTGRWDDYISANILYHLKDREDHEFCIAPTCEEIVTFLVANWATSYKQLPFNLYQIGNKFRDEIRPRFGLLRGKEFLMKDGYSFSSTTEEMEEQYQLMSRAYSRIFDRIGLDYVIVKADSGKIGKGQSEEFQAKAEIGEDEILYCGDYAANVEKAVSAPPQYTYDAVEKERALLPTPNVATIEELTAFTKLPAHAMVKTLIYKLIFADREEFIAVGIRGDRQVNEVKVAGKFAPLEIALASEEEVKKLTGCRIGFAGPIGLKIPYIADHTCQPMKNFLCGGNKEDVHYINVNWGRDCPAPEFEDYLKAEAGDGCPEVPGGVYSSCRGIEVGHIFNLGSRYTEKLGASFQDPSGQMHPIWMGTYGIGVGRTAAAVIEQSHDAKGLIWPLALAPFKISIMASSLKEAALVKVADEIYQELSEIGAEPLYDDRDERMGFKLKDSDLMGIPFKLIVGKTFVGEGSLEIESRKGEKHLVPRAELGAWVKRNLYP